MITHGRHSGSVVWSSLKLLPSWASVMSTTFWTRYANTTISRPSTTRSSNMTSVQFNLGKTPSFGRSITTTLTCTCIHQIQVIQQLQHAYSLLCWRRNIEAKHRSSRYKHSKTALVKVRTLGYLQVKHCVWTCSVNTALGNTVFGKNGKQYCCKHSVWII